MPEPIQLAIEPLLPELLAQLSQRPTVVLSAPPGAGKSTRVPLALLESGHWPEGRIILAQPRRLAARALARRMASIISEPLGKTVGYKVRFDDQSTSATRVLVVTEGLLLRQVLADPFLDGVACVILDEFHERSLTQDLLLAFLRQVLSVREDLKVLVMSATLDPGPVLDFMPGSTLLSCDLREHPLRVDYLPRPDGQHLEKSVRSGLLNLLQSDDDDGGDVLVFLPGAGEIRRTAEFLREHPLPGQPSVVSLFGALPAKEQDAVLSPGRERRVVLATNIAETSLTVPRVSTVVDSGLVKRLRSDPRSGLDRLVVERVSQASADQRAGRAGRLGPGRALRLWSESEQAGLAPRETPEMLRLDLAPVILSVLSFQPGPLDRFQFLEDPPQAHLDVGRDLLLLLGALDDQGQRLSEAGQRWARVPLHPRLAAMLEYAARSGCLEQGLVQTALLSERDILMAHKGRPPELPDGDSDLLWRVEVFLDLQRSKFRAGPARRQGANLRTVRQVEQVRSQLKRLAKSIWSRASSGSHSNLLVSRRLPLVGFPDRVCRRREAGRAEARMRGGRGVRLAQESGVRREELFLALEATAGKKGLHSVALVRLAHGIERADLEELFPKRVRQEVAPVFDQPSQAVVGMRRWWFDDLLLAEQSGQKLAPELAAEVLAREAQAAWEQVYKPDREGRQIVARLAFAAAHMSEVEWPDVSRDGLAQLMAELCRGRRSFEHLRKIDWAQELMKKLNWQTRPLLKQEVPERIQVPSKARIRLDYEKAAALGEAPVLAVKLQELFGLAQTPRIARGRVPILLHLLAPNGRPVQVTSDLKSFWNSVYPEVRKDLRGRYPKHPWPEDPWTARPTARTKRRPR